MKYLAFLIIFTSCFQSNARLSDYLSLEEQEKSLEKKLDPTEKAYCASNDVDDSHFDLKSITWYSQHISKNFQVFRKPTNLTRLSSIIEQKMINHAVRGHTVATYRLISEARPRTFNNKKYTSVAKYIKDYSSELARYIKASSECFGLDPYIYTALIEQESLFEISATSHTGAAGLTQFTTPALREISWHTRDVKNDLVEESLALFEGKEIDEDIYLYDTNSKADAHKALLYNLYKTVIHHQEARSCMEDKLGHKINLYFEKLDRRNLSKPYITGFDENVSNTKFAKTYGNSMKNLMRKDLGMAVYYGASFLNLQFSRTCFRFDLKNKFSEKDPRSCSSMFIDLNRCDSQNFSGILETEIIEKSIRAYNGASPEEQATYFKRIKAYSHEAYFETLGIRAD